MKRALKHLIAFLTVLGAFATAPAAEPTRPPNIVIILADDFGYGDLGCYGNKTYQTPNLDRLASQGVRCTDFYASTSFCSPTRAALLTGRYPQRNGVTGLGQAPKPDEVLLPQLLKKQGYVSGAFGKWHLEWGKGRQPTDRGFDEFFGFAGGTSTYYLKKDDKPTHYRGTQRAEVEGYTTDLYADAAIDFIQRHQKNPFFLYLPFNAVHEPFQPPPPPYLDLYKPKPPDQYAAMFTAMDSAIGRVLARLDALQLTDQTLVVFFSDNGAPQRSRNKPLRGDKVTLCEGGIRVPCIVRWPGKIKAGTECREPLICMDLFTLSLTAAGVPLPKPTERIIDGRDPLPALQGTAKSPHTELCFTHELTKPVQWAIRSGPYKLCETQLTRNQGPLVFGLYDVANDPQEAKDLSAEKPEVVKTLRAAFETWKKQVVLSKVSE